MRNSVVRVMLAILAAAGAVSGSCYSIPRRHCERIHADSVFFVGRVLATQLTGRREFSGSGFDPEVVKVRYRVLKAYLGARPGEELTVNRFYKPEVGSESFVQAFRWHGAIAADSVCPDLVDLEEKETLQEFLERRAAGRVRETSVSVAVFAPGASEAARFGVTLAGNGRRFAAAAGGRERAVFSGLRPGRYRAEVLAAGYVQRPGTEAGAEVVSGSCAMWLVQLEGTGVASGQVVDHAGKPVARALVRFQAPDDHSGYEWRSLTDDEGRYRVEHLPPAAYRVSAGHGPSMPPLTTDYPELVTLTADVESKLDIRLSREIARELRLRVEDPDGQALGGQEICTGDGSVIECQTADAAGVIRLRLWQGAKYERNVSSRNAGWNRVEIGESETERTVRLQPFR